MPLISVDGLRWDPEAGLGYYPVRINGQYGLDYWLKYQGYAKTPMGEKLTDMRLRLVEKYAKEDDVVDIGIGSGQFITARGLAHTWGYDVNPHGVRWLIERDRWWDPYFRPPEIVTCWDSLEHMSSPANFVQNVDGMIFVSIPIFADLDHILSSKHFRKDEHYWYFTHKGLIDWFYDYGFRCLEHSHMEMEAGREDIGTYVFARVAEFRNENP